MTNVVNIKCLIIDDDPFILSLLQDKIAQFIPELKVLDTAGSGLTGLQKIAHYQPDLIFLDVEMEDMTGFEMLAKIPQIHFRTIFITSYSHYAIKAIRFNALDYLLKPIDLGELKAAITRFPKRAIPEKAHQRMQLALNNMQNPKIAEQILQLRTEDKDLALPLKNIIRIQAERNYSFLYLTNHKKILSSKNLGEFELLLDEKFFFRSHKSHLINFMHVQKVQPARGFILSDNGEIPIARRKRAEASIGYQKYLATLSQEKLIQGKIKGAD